MEQLLLRQGEWWGGAEEGWGGIEPVFGEPVFLEDSEDMIEASG